MAAYVIADVEVLDPEAYREYTAGVPASLEPFGGRFIVRGGKVESLEGGWNPQRFVVIEFPSAEQARAWYDSADYQQILPIRHRNAHSRLIMVEGVQ